MCNFLVIRCFNCSDDGDFAFFEVVVHRVDDENSTSSDENENQTVNYQ